MTTPASDIDVSPMILDEFVSGDRRYRTEQPLVFTTEYLDEDEMYLIQGEFDIALWAPTREEVWDVLSETMDWMWRHFAEGDPEQLDGVAADRGVELRERFEQEADAA